MSEEKSKTYNITKEIEITPELREKLQKLYRKRGHIDHLQRCLYMTIPLGILINVKDKDDLKKRLYRLIEHEDCKPYHERDYDVYKGLEENPRYGLEIKCYSKTGNWMQFNAEEINLIEV